MHTHVNAAKARYLNGNFAGSSGHLARKTKVRLRPDQIKKGYTSTLIVIRDDKSRDRILVPKCQRQRLVVKEHETMLHVDGTRVHHELSRKYYWPNMIKQIKEICRACQSCQAAKVRRQQLSAAFEQANIEDLPLPRQAYGIDFYGHTHGEILVALDLCTREVSLWFLPDRKMEGVAKRYSLELSSKREFP